MNALPVVIPKIYTVGQTAVMLGTGKTKIYELMKRDLPFILVGSRRRLRDCDIAEYLSTARMGALEDV